MSNRFYDHTEQEVRDFGRRSRSTHKLYEKDKIGEVQIADEVVAIIAGLAATEVEGVDPWQEISPTNWLESLA